MSVILEVRNLSKAFPGVQALDNISISINKGEIHAIVGENGAGKSTLMKILGGVYTQDSGDIFINGIKKIIKNVQVSNMEGISVIFQEFNLMEELTVAENIFISILPKTKFFKFLERKNLNKITTALLKDLKIDLNPQTFVKNLNVHERQLVEIVKAIAINTEILIMDEPTAALSDVEVLKLYEIINTLKSQGKTILYVSHRLKEIFDIADRVTVLRDGKYIGTNEVKNTTLNNIIKMMVGRDVEQFFKISEIRAGDTILEVESLTKKNVFENISFQLKAGEILGFAGLMGCGRVEILDSIYGLRRPDSGKIFLDNKEVRIKSVEDAINKGMAYVSEDRATSGIFAQMNVKENSTINIIKKLSFLRGTIIDFRKESKIFNR